MASSKDLKKSYDDLYAAARPFIQRGEINPDPYIDDPSDRRKGLSLIFRPDQSLLESISRLLVPAQELEPALYCQPLADLHVTVMSIISCRDGFTYKDLDLQHYLDRIQPAIAEVNPFYVDFQGLSLSREAVMICGFPENGTLKQIRNRLRETFGATNDLFHTLDVRYKTILSHLTAIRYRDSLRDAEQFFTLIERYRDFNFGRMRVGTIELVETDWYARSESIVMLRKFVL